MLMLTICLLSHKCDESTTIPVLDSLLTFARAVDLLRQGLLLLVVSLELRGVEHLAVHLEHALRAHRLLAQHPGVTIQLITITITQRYSSSLENPRPSLTILLE